MLLTTLNTPLIRVRAGLLVGVVLSLAVGLLLYYTAARTIENDNELRFKNMAQAAQSTINARIKSYTDVLRASASLFQADEEVSRDDYKRFVAGLALPQHFPAIETMNYVKWVSDANRDAFENKIRREDAQANDGRPEFLITPPGRRPDYGVVLYIEPNPFWQHVVGLDLNAQPLVKQALIESRDTGTLASSGAPIKAMKERGRTGLAMRLPVYRPGATLRTAEERRAAYLGSAGLAFNVQKLVEGVLAEMPIKGGRLALFNQIDFLVASVPKTMQLLYDSEATAAVPAPPLPANDPDRFHVAVPVDFNGRKWDAHFTAPKSALYRSSDQTFIWVAMLAGFTSTMLLYGLYFTLTSSRQRAVELAQGMTKELRESQAQLLRSHEDLRRLSAHAENIKESERKRIAREIHDDLGQNLLALRIDVQLLFSRTGGKQPRLHARAATTLEHIDATIKSVRQLINDLRPNVLDLGLNAAIDWQISEFRQRNGITCELVEYHNEIVVSDHCATALFRILQESLTNVVRHARATEVRVDLRTDRGMVRMTVHDNGVGLPPNRPRGNGTFGLIGIEERVRILGGTVTLRSGPGVGTTVEVTIPVQQDEPVAVQPAQLPGAAALHPDTVS